ncbi:PREDICTED: TP53-target gene 5 protein [Propithecus coquereli]|uniref:TP53-target gene 5 protein n=1 Tax=Propithecus coquereli TaxID=379532 RepID=UPI00063F31E2|nr:PREDICTED: TP53-target gene 5 protein [Propithecus coquereli]
MSPSAKKRPKKSMVSKIQDEEPQDKIRQPVSKGIEWNRLRRVIKNLSLLKLLKSSNRRIQDLHKLAKRCWNSLLRVPKMLDITSGENNVYNKVKQNHEEFQETRCPKTPELKSRKLESIGEPKETNPKEWKPTILSRMRNEAKGSPAAVLWKEQVDSEVPSTSRGLNTGARRRQLLAEDPQIIFLKNPHHRTPMGDMKQLDVADQWIWFEGLPTRVHIPAPRVMCRSSALRWVKRCCTRFCSASLELPMYRPYKVGDVTRDGARGASREQRVDDRKIS